jgi:hypothetical protein
MDEKMNSQKIAARTLVLTPWIAFVGVPGVDLIIYMFPSKTDKK